MDHTGVSNYFPILIILVIATLFALAIIVVSRFAGRHLPNKTKLQPYECGVAHVGTARERQSVKFYLVAMVFLLFDIEAVFLIPWAVAYGNVLRDPAYPHLKYIFYGEMMMFLLVLFIGLIYVWRKGVLYWTR